MKTAIETFTAELESALALIDSWDKEEKLRSFSIRIKRVAWSGDQFMAREMAEKALSAANRIANTLMRDSGTDN